MEQHRYQETVAQTALRWLYSILLVLAAPLAYLSLLKRGVRKQRHDSRHFLSRFGCVARPEQTGGYFFHCVSVGEVVAASCLIRQIMQHEPTAAISISTTTPTGSARVRAIFGKTVHHFYLPFDFPFSMRWMLSRIRPKAVCITEVELWPNLIHACWKKQIPVMVVNARMTDRSAKRYGKLRGLFLPMLKKLSCVCAQGMRDYNNYLHLGMPEGNLVLTNNIKFDQAVSLGDELNAEFNNLDRSTRFIIVAGSTHAPEEQTLIAAIDQLQPGPSTGSPLLFLVPRHPERFDEVADLLASKHKRFVRTSTNEACDDETEVVLLDEMGRLNEAYSCANVAFVGGSLADRGGHNALEPAAFGIPIMMGPHTYNNPVICEYLESSGALHVVGNTAEITRCIQRWIDRPAEASEAGQAAKQVLAENSGALDKTLYCLQKITN
ncbi:3-deoxy-D-manno-octulosonic acid transferase [Salinimonas chungwhensis]|uniref:3-deoxy-D-manno-octulosonic acid transferase n=1 Tax=Salinimonas chungwhensis TaxID=265425 RepID=UPI00036C52ED|nr:3-deoxy-D-manno-octulosonic acid transferase [Salinimonas chungwhensis]